MKKKKSAVPPPDKAEFRARDVVGNARQRERFLRNRASHDLRGRTQAERERRGKKRKSQGATSQKKGS